MGDKHGLWDIYYHLSDAYFLQKNYSEAKKYGEKSLDLSTEINEKNSERKSLTMLSNINMKTTNFKEAYTYLIKANLLKDSLFSENKQNEIDKLNIKYQTTQKENENKKLDYQNSLQKEENEKIKAQNILIILSSLFAILLLIAIFVILRKSQKHKFNKQLLREIDEQNDIIAKNLHDGMSGYLHSVRDSLLHKNENNNLLNNEIKIIKRSQKELRFLMKQLSSPFYKNKNFSLAEELNDLNNFYENTSNFKIESYFDNSISWENISYENKLQIYKLAQELLANVKKHSGASQINLQIIKDKKDLLLSIEDNGKGFDTKATNQGYGLKNITKRMEELKGEIQIDSSAEKGTFISLKLPILN